MRPEQVQDERYGRQLTTQQRMKDNGNRRRLAHQHPSDLLCSLTRERDRRRTPLRCLNCALSLAISDFPHARCEAHDAHLVLNAFMHYCLGSCNIH